jgi:hypothetical protein
MSALADKLRKAREVKVEAYGFTFTCRRPTDLEMIELRGARIGRAIMPYVIGWDGVTELSMTGSGAPHPLDFDHEACTEWLADRLDLLGAITEGVFNAYQAHAEKVQAAVKN